MLKKLTKHVGLTYKNGGDICVSIIAETKYTVPQLATLTAPANPRQLTANEQVAQKMFNKWLDALIKHKSILDANI